MLPRSCEAESRWRLGADVYKCAADTWARLEGGRVRIPDHFMEWMSREDSRPESEVRERADQDVLKMLQRLGFVIPADLTTLQSVADFEPGPLLGSANAGQTALVGVAASSAGSAPACAKGPEHIRRQCGLLRIADGYSYHSGLGLSVEHPLPLQDLGNLDNPAHLCTVSSQVGPGARIIILGGDHILTWYGLYGLCEKHDAVCLWHIDAHPDCSSVSDPRNDRLNHASVMRFAQEHLPLASIVQIGVRSIEHHAQRPAPDAGKVPVFRLRLGLPEGELRAALAKNLEGASTLAVSVDIDALDPSVAPGVSDTEPGGLSYGVLSNILGLAEDILPPAYVDIVETAEMEAGPTSRAAAALLSEILVRRYGQPDDSVVLI